MDDDDMRERLVGWLVGCWTKTVGKEGIGLVGWRKASSELPGGCPPLSRSPKRLLLPSITLLSPHIGALIKEKMPQN
jgi:hypothetical protein